MEDMKLIAKKRAQQGSANARRLRGTGNLPGVVYGADNEPVPIELVAHNFEQIMHHHASESVLIDITLEGEGDMSVLVKDVQHHPVTGDLLHVDLLRIAANKPIQVEIPVDLVGEAAGVKAGGSLDQVTHSISVECLPGDLVEAFELDVSALEIGDALYVSDLKVGDTFKLLVDEESIVAAVSSPKVEEEEEELAGEAGEEASGEPEVIGEKKDEEESA